MTVNANCTFERVVPALGFQKYYDLVITTDATVDSTDTITFLKSTYGTVVGMQAYNVTDDTIETYAIGLSSDTYTITAGTGANKARVYILKMRRLS
jgi:hypothetical protein